MADTHELLASTVVRLGRFARPFETVDQVVNRILDTCEATLDDTSSDDIVSDGDVKDFDWQTPPDLTHTKVLSVEFNKMKFPRAETTWNSVLMEAIRVAAGRVDSKDELKRLILVNYVMGKKEDEGYRYLDDVKISVQGQDANAAWRAVSHIANRLRLPFEIAFTWRVKKGAVHPGVMGRFFFNGRIKPKLKII